MAETEENKPQENTEDTNNSADLQGLKEEVSGFKKVIESFKSFFETNKEDDKKTEPLPVPPADSGSNADLKAIKELLEKEREDNKKRFEDLEKKYADSEKEKGLKKLNEAILKAKEVGFIATDDKTEVEWLTKILTADYDGTLKKITDFTAKGTPKPVPPVDKEAQKSIYKQLARESIRDFFN